MWKQDPDKVEYWFDLNPETLVMSFHSLIREMQCNKFEKVLNIIIEFSSMDKHTLEKRYSMIVIKSNRPLSKYSLIEMLKKNLISNKVDWRSGK